MCSSHLALDGITGYRVSWHVVTDGARRRQNSLITARQCLELLEVDV
jgi:hypothetical protein